MNMERGGLQMVKDADLNTLSWGSYTVPLIPSRRAVNSKLFGPLFITFLTTSPSHPLPILLSPLPRPLHSPCLFLPSFTLPSLHSSSFVPLSLASSPSISFIMQPFNALPFHVPSLPSFIPTFLSPFPLLFPPYSPYICSLAFLPRPSSNVLLLFSPFHSPFPSPSSISSHSPSFWLMIHLAATQNKDRFGSPQLGSWITGLDGDD